MVIVRRETGQTIVEFAIILSALLIMTVGLIDAGRAYFAYNAVAAAARYGARWGGVVGAECLGGVGSVGSSNDWCTNEGPRPATGFWGESGNQPVLSTYQCPSSGLPDTAQTQGVYQVSNFANSSTKTTIVGAIAQHFDTNSSSSNFVVGNLTPGLDLTKLYVCIQMPDSWVSGTLEVHYGDSVRVYVYYPFRPAGPLLGSTTMNLIATSTYSMET